ncbi:MAG: Crp/Fnr family transcriptional regulator [Clostridia bacterium]|jgi:CRP-like cAMP-binding protein|nr:Crp/Fnr family transcriptional regulator [Clostridia bacterium]
MNVSPSSRIEKILDVQFECDFKSAIDSSSAEKNYPKDYAIIRQGDALNTLYFIINGIVRGYYLDESGREITKCFSKENQFAGMEGLLGPSKASFSVECLEDVTCIALPYQIFHASTNISRQFYELLEKTSKTKMLDLENHYKDLMLLDAEGRYRMFLKRYASIEQRIKQEYIASYIGIQPSSLCRIKRKMKNHLSD